jgi:tetratricopeptide (TPR) repeat protein
MKKNVSSELVLVLVVVLSFMLLFTGCERLSVSHLSANYHVKRANKAYADEQYKAAATEYEAALAENQDLKWTYLYIGTAYTQVYKPGKSKDDPRNKDNNVAADKAVEYLLKAKDVEPNNDKVIMALGDIYDKLGNFDEAKGYYMKLLEKDSKNPRSYYTMASFLRKNGKNDEAEQMYLKRIELDPQNPEGYQYYTGLLGDMRRFSEMIDAHKKRLYAMVDPSIVMIMSEIQKITKDNEQVKKITDHMDLIRKNKNVDQQEKNRLLQEDQALIEGKLSPAEGTKKLAELDTQLQDKIKKAEAAVTSLPDDIKGKIVECYYAIGQGYWNWSYQTPPEMMDPKTRGGIIENGLNALNKAIEVQPDYAYAISYIGLLYREKIKIDPMNAEKYKKLNDEYNKKFIDVYTKQKKSEDYKKKLEEMGKEAGK